jgi:hypothetical protein
MKKMSHCNNNLQRHLNLIKIISTILILIKNNTINESRKDTRAHIIIYYNVKGIEFMKAKTKTCISLMDFASQQNKNVSKKNTRFANRLTNIILFFTLSPQPFSGEI